MGASHTPLLRRVPSDYADGVSSLAGADRASPREISNVVVAQSGSIQNPLDASDYLWQWGQFLDHDIDLTETAHPVEPADIPVPAGDPDFDPRGTGTVVIPFDRSVHHEKTSPRQQLNQITGWMDGSNVYGSDDVRAAALRTNDGSGRLATSAGDVLPWNSAGLPNAATQKLNGGSASPTRSAISD